MSQRLLARLIRGTRYAGLAALALGASTFAGAVACPGPDAFNHDCTDLPMASCPAGVGAAVVPGMGDDTCTVRPIGFTFKYYGVDYTSVGVASNGFLQLGGCGVGATDFTNDCPIPNALTPNQHIMGVWDDLNPAAGMVTDGLTGAVGARIYTVKWTAVPFFAAATTATFEIQLYENTPVGEKAWVRIASSAQADYSSGMENTTGADGIGKFCDAGSLTFNCTEYKMGPPPFDVPGALEGIEAKLDDETSFTDDGELAGAVDAISDDLEALDVEIDAELAIIVDQVASIEAKLDSLEIGSEALCEIIDILLTPQGRRCSDTDTCGFGAFPEGLEGVPDPACEPVGIAGKGAPTDADLTTSLAAQVTVYLDTMLRSEALPAPVLMMPASQGGLLDGVASLVESTLAFYRGEIKSQHALYEIEDALAAGQKHQEDEAYASAFKSYRKAYLSLTKLAQDLE